ncbi:uncharacterized protein LOC132903506 [Amyelois transitella]|uniref:uncharacterized protein LOC132903506 n=1 Tax=Amyelois transitella TaxID=680683 RepID=UPI00298FC063|nr:uncharacterized protein LOC132903506 [Amyelois transitella]
MNKFNHFVFIFIVVQCYAAVNIEKFTEDSAFNDSERTASNKSLTIADWRIYDESEEEDKSLSDFDYEDNTNEYDFSGEDQNDSPEIEKIERTSETKAKRPAILTDSKTKTVDDEQKSEEDKETHHNNVEEIPELLLPRRRTMNPRPDVKIPKTVPSVADSDYPLATPHPFPMFRPNFGQFPNQLYKTPLPNYPTRFPIYEYLNPLREPPKPTFNFMGSPAYSYMSQDTTNNYPYMGQKSFASITFKPFLRSYMQYQF